MSDIEYSDVVVAGKRALQYLKDARESLNGAWAWGIADTIGGGLLPGCFKHSDIKKSKKQIVKAEQELEAFNGLLERIDIFDELDLEIDGFIKIIDLWRDNILIDFVVQGRIKEARKQLDEAIDTMESVLSELLREDVISHFKK